MKSAFLSSQCGRSFLLVAVVGCVMIGPGCGLSGDDMVVIDQYQPNGTMRRTVLLSNIQYEKDMFDKAKVLHLIVNVILTDLPPEAGVAIIGPKGPSWITL